MKLKDQRGDKREDRGWKGELQHALRGERGGRGMESKGVMMTLCRHITPLLPLLFPTPQLFLQAQHVMDVREGGCVSVAFTVLNNNPVTSIKTFYSSR